MKAEPGPDLSTCDRQQPNCVPAAACGVYRHLLAGNECSVSRQRKNISSGLIEKKISFWSKEAGTKTEQDDRRFIGFDAGTLASSAKKHDFQFTFHIDKSGIFKYLQFVNNSQQTAVYGTNGFYRLSRANKPDPSSQNRHTQGRGCRKRTNCES